MIVVAGEALVDLVPQEQHGASGLPPMAPRLGGGPFNVAIAAARLGAPVAFVSRLSYDSFGAALLDHLRETGVDVRGVQRGSQPTTLAVVGIGAGGSANYSFYVDGTADRYFDVPAKLPAEVSALAFGTLSMVLEPGATAYERLLKSMSAQGKLIVLDPNIRAELIPDPDTYRARFLSWLPHVDIVKVSEEDALWLTRRDLGSSDDDAHPDAIHEAFPGWSDPAALVITRGMDGLAVVFGGTESISVPSVATEVVDTIGAGDTVVGALLAWLHHHNSLSRDGVRRMGGVQWTSALTFAARAAAITVSRAGAEPPYLAELGGP